MCAKMATTTDMNPNALDISSPSLSFSNNSAIPAMEPAITSPAMITLPAPVLIATTPKAAANAMEQDAYNILDVSAPTVDDVLSTMLATNFQSVQTILPHVCVIPWPTMVGIPGIGEIDNHTAAESNIGDGQTHNSSNDSHDDNDGHENNLPNGVTDLSSLLEHDNYLNASLAFNSSSSATSIGSDTDPIIVGPFPASAREMVILPPFHGDRIPVVYGTPADATSSQDRVILLPLTQQSKCLTH
jgi:hypothetical protein